MTVTIYRYCHSGNPLTRPASGARSTAVRVLAYEVSSRPRRSTMSRRNPTTSTIAGRPLGRSELDRIDAWWRAANYLSVGQIYLMDNPLLREKLLPEHVKPRLLGHWGTTPGLNFVYAHLNRTITARDLDMMYIIGPGHGGPGLVASAWLDGTFTDVFPT